MRYFQASTATFCSHEDFSQLVQSVLSSETLSIPSLSTQQNNSTVTVASNAIDIMRIALQEFLVFCAFFNSFVLS